MSLPTETLTALVVVSLALNVFALLLLALRGGRRAREPGDPLRLDEALRAVLDRQSDRIGRLEQALRALTGSHRRHEDLLQRTIRRVGLVRFDAFEDVGGRLSFSCALLDDLGDGVVVTSINGRQDTRVYAKPVLGGASSYNLSAEEEAAIRQAMQAPPGERRWRGEARAGGRSEAVRAT
ncbi:MAG TPA: DUF4446 family protein [Actinomycetota bacterium]|nr:DUF4446 family protein [Actinomycetota bacterium]